MLDRSARQRAARHPGQRRGHRHRTRGPRARGGGGVRAPAWASTRRGDSTGSSSGSTAHRGRPRRSAGCRDRPDDRTNDRPRTRWRRHGNLGRSRTGRQLHTGPAIAHCRPRIEIALPTPAGASGSAARSIGVGRDRPDRFGRGRWRQLGVRVRMISSSTSAGTARMDPPPPSAPRLAPIRTPRSSAAIRVTEPRCQRRPKQAEQRGAWPRRAVAPLRARHAGHDRIHVATASAPRDLAAVRAARSGTHPGSPSACGPTCARFANYTPLGIEQRRPCPAVAQRLDARLIGGETLSWVRGFG